MHDDCRETLADAFAQPLLLVQDNTRLMRLTRGMPFKESPEHRQGGCIGWDAGAVLSQAPRPAVMVQPSTWGQCRL